MTLFDEQMHELMGLRQAVPALAEKLTAQRVENELLRGLLQRAMGQLGKWQQKYGTHQPDWLPPDGDIRLAEDVADALKPKEAIQPPTEIGWLVENGKQGDELRYRTWKDGVPTWTADPNEATRYCRRIDAERAHQEDDDAWRIVEHAWHHMPPNGGINPAGPSGTVAG